MKNSNSELVADRSAPSCSQLFRVAVTYETVIRANTEEEAKKAVQYGMGEIDDTPTSVESRPIERLEDLPPVWDANCRPWGERDPYDRNIGQILSANSKEQEPL